MAMPNISRLINKKFKGASKKDIASTSRAIEEIHDRTGIDPSISLKRFDEPLPHNIENRRDVIDSRIQEIRMDTQKDLPDDWSRALDAREQELDFERKKEQYRFNQRERARQRDPHVSDQTRKEYEELFDQSEVVEQRVKREREYEELFDQADQKLKDDWLVSKDARERELENERKKEQYRFNQREREKLREAEVLDREEVRRAEESLNEPIRQKEAEKSYEELFEEAEKAEKERLKRSSEGDKYLNYREKKFDKMMENLDEYSENGQLDTEVINNFAKKVGASSNEEYIRLAESGDLREMESFVRNRRSNYASADPTITDRMMVNKVPQIAGGGLATVGLFNALNNNKGQQTNAQLYGQQPYY